MSYRSNSSKLSALLIAACLFAPGAWAAPSEIATSIHADKPHGKGSFGALFITAYDAELWTDSPSWSMDEPFALKVRYRMSFSSDEIVSRSKKEMRHVDPSLTGADLDLYGDAMTKVFPPVHSGDTLTALYKPGQPVRFFHNGNPTGEIADQRFAEVFFGIWLSPRTAAPGLRKRLLKGS